jgi:F0F1-type ATP synthase membrane subunit b/b'
MRNTLITVVIALTMVLVLWITVIKPVIELIESRISTINSQLDSGPAAR